MSSSALYVFDSDQLTDARRLFVVGDLHGDLVSLDQFLQLVDLGENLVVFLGDYADRGEDGLGVVDRVTELLREYPRRVIGLKGNHEDFAPDGRPRFSPCHLVEEAKERRSGWERYFRQTYTPFLERLFLGALIPNETLFVHGGISGEIGSVACLATPTPSIETAVLYGDATERFTGERFNQRRAKGNRFGDDVTAAVCQALSVKRIVRGHQHELARNGPHLQHGGKLWTVISTVVFSRRPYVVAIDPQRLDVLEKFDLRSGRVAPITP